MPICKVEKMGCTSSNSIDNHTVGDVKFDVKASPVGEKAISKALTNLGVDDEPDKADAMDAASKGLKEWKTSIIEHNLPDVGFCIKTHRNGVDKKVFVNVFHHNDVHHMLCTSCMDAVDKDEVACDRFDVVINSKVLKECVLSATTKEWVSFQVLKYLNESQKAGVETSNLKFPKLKRGFVGENTPTFLSFQASSVDNEDLEISITKPSDPEVDNLTTHIANEVSPTQSPESNAQEEKEKEETNLVNEVADVDDDEGEGNSMCFAGYALKRSGNAFIGMQTRFFSLKEDEDVIYYYVQTSDFLHAPDKSAKGKIDLSDLDMAVVNKPDFSFYHPANISQIIIPMKGGRLFEITCVAPGQSSAWVSVIENHIKRMKSKQ